MALRTALLFQRPRGVQCPSKSNGLGVPRRRPRGPAKEMGSHLHSRAVVTFQTAQPQTTGRVGKITEAIRRAVSCGPAQAASLTHFLQHVSSNSRNPEYVRPKPNWRPPRSGAFISHEVTTLPNRCLPSVCPPVGMPAPWSGTYRRRHACCSARARCSAWEGWVGAGRGQAGGRPGREEHRVAGRPRR